MIVSYGQNLFLSCVAEGKPTPTITWSKTGSAIQSQAVYFPNGLNLYSVSSSDNGVYTCNATNSHGSNSTTASVSVTSKFVIITLCV